MQERNVSAWEFPPAASVEINVDGGVSRSVLTGVAAAVCRGDQSLYLGASALVLPGVTGPTTLEVLACCEGPALALDLYLQRLHVASDCLNVVTLLQGEEGNMKLLSRKS